MDPALYIAWGCCQADAGWVGVRAEELRTLVEAKSGKAAGYRQRTRADEVLLVLYATGWSVSQTAGSNLYVRREADRIAGVLKQSGFDRIFFHDSLEGWHQQLFP